MTSPNFKVGDTVMLKSGGPIMTVDSIGQYNGLTKARCIWFNDSETKSDVFPLETLSVEE
ncbi:YodC family protein [Sulfitobacter sp. M13]